MADSPWLEVERTAATVSAPASRSSSGRVTSDSTWVASRPGASACTSTCGGAKSGNTSSRALRSAPAPRSAMRSESAVTIFGCARDPRTMAASMWLVVVLFGRRAVADSLQCPQPPGALRDDRIGVPESGDQPCLAHPCQRMHGDRLVRERVRLVTRDAPVHIGARACVHECRGRHEQTLGGGGLQLYGGTRPRAQTLRAAIQLEQPS